MVISEGTTVDAVGAKTLGAGVYRVLRIASITDDPPAATGSASTGSSATTTVAADAVRYLEVVVEAADDDSVSTAEATEGSPSTTGQLAAVTPTQLWVPVGPGMIEQSDDDEPIVRPCPS